METGDGINREVATDTLAEWIEHQGEDRWWRVDGDPLLTGILSFPCPGDELAETLRRISRTFHETLFIHGRDVAAVRSGELTWRDLDAFAEHFGAVAGGQSPGGHDRVLVLRWNRADEEWLLIEDDDATEFYRREAAMQGKDS